MNGGWAGWSAWSGCAAGICAGNQRIRTRTCTSPIPSDGGAWCTGENAEQLDCLSKYSLQSCCFVIVFFDFFLCRLLKNFDFILVDGGYTEWSQWSLCENPCGGSIVNRTRNCTNPTPTADGKPCSGDSFQTKLECTLPCSS